MSAEMLSKSVRCNALIWPKLLSMLVVLCLAVGIGVTPVFATGGPSNSSEVVATGVSLNKTVDNIVYGNADTLVPSFTPPNATNQAVSWSSDNTAVAMASSTGVVTPGENGTAVITVTTLEGGLTAACDVTVTGASVSGPTTFMMIRVNGGTPIPVTAAQILALNTSNTLSYFSDNKGYSTCLGAPLAQILFTCTSLTSSQVQSVSATFIGSDDYAVSLTALQLFTRRYYYPSTGGQVQVAPIIAVEEADSATAAVTDPTQLSVSECLRNLYGQAFVGEATASNFDKNIKEIDVSYVPVTSVSLASNDTIALGGTDALPTVITPAAASNQSLTWASSSPGVATVDQTGAVTAVTPGAAKITAATQDGSNITSAPCVVTVPPAAIAITGVVLSKTTDQIVAGNSDQLTATITPDSASYQNLSWTSDTPGVARVNNTGLVTGVAAGAAKITAATQDGSNITSAPCVVTVQAANPGSVTGVSLGETTDTIKYGATDTLVATVSPPTANQTVTWSSDNPAAATVGSTTGVVTPVHWGTANITATTQVGGLTASCAVTVIGGPTTSLVITVNGGAPVTVTAAQINALTSPNTLVDYSATGSGGASLYFTAVGAPLAQLLTTYAGVPGSAAQNVSVTFIGSDNYTISLTASQLFARRYYYPVIGSPAQVVPIIATAEADQITTDPAQLSPSECLRNFYGQASSTEHTSHDLDQNLREIDVTYAGAPVVSGINPATGSKAGGTPVIITGSNLSVVSTVYFGATPDTSFTTNVAGTQISATSPPGTGTVDTAVYSSVDGLSSTFAPFTYYSQATGGGGGGGAAVSYTPAVQTESASSVTADSAVLNGDITSDNGYDITDYGFLWGASSGSLTSKLDAGADNHSGDFTATLSGLTAGTTYYFQAYATNSQGTADGAAVMSFTTTGSVQATTPATYTAPVFSDVSASNWAYGAISSLSSQGLVSGYPDGSFKPDATITRAEFATMLVKALGLSTAGTAGQFTDVTADSWYYGSVNDAVYASLVSGMGDHLFAPEALITREQMAVMMTKALGDKAPAVDGTELNVFSDRTSVGSWAVTGMEEAVKAGIVNGMTAGTLAPQSDATRAQAAAMIYKMLSVSGK
jgi:uncharacterized protein YjdB